MTVLRESVGSGGIMARSTAWRSGGAPLLQHRHLLRGELPHGRIAGGIAGQRPGFGQLAVQLLHGPVVLHQLGELLLLARHLGGAARVGVKGRLRHLRIAFVEAPLERGDVRQRSMGKVGEAVRFANCTSRGLRLGYSEPLGGEPRLKVTISHGHHALHAEHHRLHLGFRQDLIPGYMQCPLFRHYGIDEARFWAETNPLAEHYAKRGYRLSSEISYLNHLLTYVLAGLMPKLNNRLLRQLGAEIELYPGLPEFFARSKAFVQDKPEYRKHELQLEHYVVSTGLAEMIRGSAVAAHVEAIWGCEFIENPLQPGFLQQKEFELSAEAEIAQIGMIIDNTTKTRALFEINKGTNKNPSLDVNARIPAEDRRIPFQNMIYVADGPSDIPCFSLVLERGGKTYGVYNPGPAR